VHPFTITTEVAGPFPVENLPNSPVAAPGAPALPAAPSQQNQSHSTEQTNKPSPPPSLQPSAPPPLNDTGSNTESPPAKNWLWVLIIMLISSAVVLVTKGNRKARGR